MFSVAGAQKGWDCKFLQERSMKPYAETSQNVCGGGLQVLMGKELKKHTHNNFSLPFLQAKTGGGSSVDLYISTRKQDGDLGGVLPERKADLSQLSIRSRCKNPQLKSLCTSEDDPGLNFACSRQPGEVCNLSLTPISERNGAPAFAGELCVSPGFVSLSTAQVGDMC